MVSAPQTIRAFLAIEPSDAVRDAVESLLKRLGQCPDRVSWLKRDALHLTLRFLGDVEPEVLTHVGETVVGPLSQLDGFTLGVREVGVFPNQRRPRVVWVGLESVPDQLLRVQRTVEEAVRSAGLESDQRGFKPHLTLGRVRGSGLSSEFSELLASEKEFDGGEFSVDSVSLFSSQLTPHGAVHTRLKEIPLRWISTLD